MSDKRDYTYVVKARCGCRIDMHFDDRTNGMTIQATSQWLFNHTKRGHNMVRVPSEDAALDICPHPPEDEPKTQQSLF